MWHKRKKGGMEIEQGNQLKALSLKEKWPGKTCSLPLGAALCQHPEAGLEPLGLFKDIKYM